MLDDYLPAWAPRLLLTYADVIGMVVVPAMLVNASAALRGEHVTGPFPRDWHLYVFGAVVGVCVNFLSIALHEAGHALAARHVGMAVRSVRIGKGPKLASFRIGSSRVDIHAIPSTGLTTYPPSPMASARQRRLVVAAGPAAHVLLILVALAVWLVSPVVAIIVIFLNVELLRANLRARPPKVSESHGSDGWQLQQLRRGGDEMLRQKYVHDHVRRVLQGDPSAAIKLLEGQLATCAADDDSRRRPLLIHLAHQFARAGRFEEAGQVWGDVLSMLAPDEPDRPLIGASWADAVLSHAVITGAELDPVNLQACHEALSAVSDQTRGVTHTRALFALATGRLPEAVELARTSLVADKPEQEERHIVAATISLALARLGDLPAARAWLMDVPPATPFAEAARSAVALEGQYS